MKFVVIGADAAGMSAASRLKRRMPDWEVTVCEKTSDVSYSAWGLPYNIGDPRRGIEDLIVRKAEVFREKQGIHLLTGHPVDRIDRQKKTVNGTNVEGQAFEAPFDQLLIATGADPVVPEIPGADLPGIMAVKTLEDGRRIKRFIDDHGVKRVAIIGMGYIALEMCENLTARGLKVAMVKPGPRFLPWLAKDLADIVKIEIEQNGVAVHAGHAPRRIERSESGLAIVCDDLEIDCDMVLIGIGVTPNSRIARDAGLDLSVQNSISVDRTLRTSDPDIFAAGDCADAYHVVTEQKAWIPLALRANRAGWAVADNAVGGSVELQGIAGTAVFKVFELEVARTGLNPSEAKKAGFEPVEVVIQSSSRAHSYPGGKPIWVQLVADRPSGRLLGAQTVGKEGAAHRINAPAVALHSGMTLDQFSQTDLAYAPPFGPTWDPCLTAANQLSKKM